MRRHAIGRRSPRPAHRRARRARRYATAASCCPRGRCHVSAMSTKRSAPCGSNPASSSAIFAARARAVRTFLRARSSTSDEECTVGGAIGVQRVGAADPSLRSPDASARPRPDRRARKREDRGPCKGGRASRKTPPASRPFRIPWSTGSSAASGTLRRHRRRGARAASRLPRRGEIGLGAFPFPDETSALGLSSSRRASPRRCIPALPRVLRRRIICDRPRAHRRMPPSWSTASGTMVYAEKTRGRTTTCRSTRGSRSANITGAAGRRASAVVRGRCRNPRGARRLRHAVPASGDARTKVAPYLLRRRDAASRRTGQFRIARPAPQSHSARRHAADAGRSRRESSDGHLGSGHPHQNFAALSPNEVHAAEAVVERTLRDVVAMGGTVSAAEHGIGKIKSRWLPLQLSPMQLGVMRAIKAELDPLGLLAPGNISTDEHRRPPAGFRHVPEPADRRRRLRHRHLHAGCRCHLAHGVARCGPTLCRAHADRVIASVLHPRASRRRDRRHRRPAQTGARH